MCSVVDHRCGNRSCYMSIILEWCSLWCLYSFSLYIEETIFITILVRLLLVNSFEDSLKYAASAVVWSLLFWIFAVTSDGYLEFHTIWEPMFFSLSLESELFCGIQLYSFHNGNILRLQPNLSLALHKLSLCFLAFIYGDLYHQIFFKKRVSSHFIEWEFQYWKIWKWNMRLLMRIFPYHFIYILNYKWYNSCKNLHCIYYWSSKTIRKNK